MTLVQILPVVGLLGAVLVAVSTTFTEIAKTRGFWIFWAIYAAAFGAFSVWAIAEDGLMMFWINHSANLIGNQVWLDLLFALAIAWVLVLPEARAREMNVNAWLVFVLLTATIGFGAMLARLLYLRSKDPR